MFKWSCLEDRVKTIMTRTINKAPDRLWHQAPTDLFYTKGHTHVVAADRTTSLGIAYTSLTRHPETKFRICKSWDDAPLISFQMGGFQVDSKTAPASIESTLFQQCTKFPFYP